MVNFHEDKLWQSAYMALIDMHEALESNDGEGRSVEISKDLLESGHRLAAMIADSLTRSDRRIARDLIVGATGVIAEVRTHLAVAWGMQLFDDETFKDLDTRYARLSEDLQRIR